VAHLQPPAARVGEEVRHLQQVSLAVRRAGPIGMPRLSSEAEPAMTVTLHATTKIVELQTADGRVPARIWEGTTESGIPVHAFITRVAVDRAEDTREFERELFEQRAPSAAVSAAYPLRLVL
jgi:hypothetical protein